MLNVPLLWTPTWRENSHSENDIKMYIDSCFPSLRLNSFQLTSCPFLRFSLWHNYIKLTPDSLNRYQRFLSLRKGLVMAKCVENLHSKTHGCPKRENNATCPLLYGVGLSSVTVTCGAMNCHLLCRCEYHDKRDLGILSPCTLLSTRSDYARRKRNQHFTARKYHKDATQLPFDCPKIMARASHLTGHCP